MGPPDPILGISEAFKRDTDPRKVNLGVGAYRDDNNKPWVLPSVRAAEEHLFNQHADHEYLPISGLDTFRTASVNLAYGESSDVVQNKKVASLQALSGTGSLRIGMEFINRFLTISKTVLVPGHTWGNHKTIAKDAGLEWKEYTYYDNSIRGINIEGLISDLESAPDGCVVLLHSCAHNPTGADPTPDQWNRIKETIRNKDHLPFFDMAYQGFASGSVENDGAALRNFVDSGLQVFLAQSFAKNFGLYGQRVGCFSMITESEEETNRAMSQLKIIARPMYSNPPLFGARLVSTVLNTPDLSQQWFSDVKLMADRIIDMRARLVEGLTREGSAHDWKHVTDQIGMFAFTGLTKPQCEAITKDHHVYLTMDGRISIAGLNTSNVDYVAKAIHEVTA